MNIRRADPAAHQRQAAPKRGGRNSGLAAFDVRERDRVVAGEHRADLVVGNPAVFDLGAECGEELAQGAQRALAEHPELDGKILRAEQLQGVEKHRHSLVGEDAPEEEKAKRACFRGCRRPDSRACLESQVQLILPRNAEGRLDIRHVGNGLRELEGEPAEPAATKIEKHHVPGHGGSVRRNGGPDQHPSCAAWAFGCLQALSVPRAGSQPCAS